METLNLIDSPANFLTEKYNHLSTVDLLSQFEKNGFKLEGQAKSRLVKPVNPLFNPLWDNYSSEVKTNKLERYNSRLERYNNRLGHERHWISLSNDTLTDKLDKQHKLSLRVMNSFDGSSSLVISLDILRLVCLNGLVAPRSIFSYKISHRKKSILDDAIEASYKIIEKTDILKDQIERMQSITLTRNDQLILLEGMIKARFPDSHERINASDNLHLLAPRRYEEKNDTLYQNFNSIQENLIRGSKIYVINDMNKLTLEEKTVRQVKSLATADSFNDTAWNHALSLAI